MSNTKRKQISDSVIAELLAATRRRCCLCYFLDGDKRRKKVQIAHIDQKRNNNNESNLVPLCLEHHDEYDSSTSQSKGITKNELIIYKNKLIEVFADSKNEDEEISVAEREIPDLSTDLFYGYGILFSEISRVLFEHDPIGINFGGNKDEYDAEAHDIISKLQNNQKCLSTERICFDVFSHWFSQNLAGTVSDYEGIGKIIDDKWNRFKQRSFVYYGNEEDS